MPAIYPNSVFHYLEDVVTLNRTGVSLPEAPSSNKVYIRSAEREDVRAITQVDHTAFIPPWQLSYTDLWQAHRVAATATIALYNNQVIGYQMSTRHRTHAHLARLAVLPNSQGQRVGARLLHDLITRIMRRGIRSITVNTQDSNIRSQRLYRRYGFLPQWV